MATAFWRIDKRTGKQRLAARSWPLLSAEGLEGGPS